MQSLDEKFTLLDLLPGEFGCDIVCETRVASLHGGVSYEAVSYVWMEAAGWRDIQVSGERVRVTKNLYAALQRFRYSARIRTL